MSDLVETTVPCTSHNQELGEWAKLLSGVKKRATDAYDFQGEWLRRGSITYALPGALVLECAGYRTKSDQRNQKKRLMVLWRFNGEAWDLLASTTDRGWAMLFRKLVIEAWGEK